MSYPQKLSTETILVSAMSYIGTHGLDTLTMRTLATTLGVTPNALYRYFPSKAALEYAMADQAGLAMLTVLKQAAANKNPSQAMVAIAKVYVQFACDNHALYALKMRHGADPLGRPNSHDAVWAFVMDVVARLQTRWDTKNLAMSLWAFLHGLVELNHANLLEGRPPEAAMTVGLEVLLAGLTSPQ
ncbi:MAG: TetR/AcrR family transcriptional regulator [Aquabacterium sp.]|nr:TetR/AcrR family transcriptional regulator [Aquabacterium sp.]